MDKLNLKQKLLQIRKGVEYIQKTEDGSANAKYIDPAVLLMKIRKKMDENNVLLVPQIKSYITKRESNPTKNNKDQMDFVIEIVMEFEWLDCDSDDKITSLWIATASNMKDPAFAFGSALTYTERYYLLKFFQIPTSKDDPEYFNLKTEECISEDQAVQLMTIITSKGYTGTAIDKICKRGLNVDKVEQVKQSKFEDALNILNDMPAKGEK